MTDFDKFLPDALADSRYAAVSVAKVVRNGFAAIPVALERQRRGVSATRPVVTV